MGGCKSREAPKHTLYVSVLQGNKTDAYLLHHEIEFDFAKIYVRYAQWGVIDPCDFVIFITNGTDDLNKECRAAHRLNDRPCYVLPAIPDNIDTFKGWVHLFAKIYLQAQPSDAAN